MNDAPQWYIRKDGVVHGPAATADLRALLDAGRITLDQEASHAQSGPWQPLRAYAEFAPVRPISELFDPPAAPPASHSSSPTAERLLAEALGTSPAAAAAFAPAPASAPVASAAEPVAASPAPAPNANAVLLAPSERAELLKGLTSEIKKSIDDKSMPWSIGAAILTMILFARFNIGVAVIIGIILGAILHKIIKSSLEEKLLFPINDYSDQMLLNRHNEAKADRRAARNRTLIEWAVIIIVGVILFLFWLAAHSPN